MEKSPGAFRTISEVAEDLDLPQHVLRFWETRFSQIRPLKRGGGRRYYRPDDVDLLRGIRHLLYGRGYTIRGVQRILKDEGLRKVQALVREQPDGKGLPDAPGDRAIPEVEALELIDSSSEPIGDAAATPVILEAVENRTPEPLPPLQRRPSASFSGNDLAALRRVLDDLVECQRVLERLRPEAASDVSSGD